MKTVRFFYVMAFFLAFFSCEKDNESNDKELIGGGNNNSCYEELSVVGLPNFHWMLEGGIDSYNKWYEDIYYDFGVPWKWGSCGGILKKHNGWDISIKEGSIVGKEVYAAYDGVVVAANYYGKGFADFATIEHVDRNGNKFTTTYGHINYLKNIQGTNVIAGQHIGYIADIKDPHLHFSVRRAEYSNNNRSNANVANAGALPAKQNDCDCTDKEGKRLPVFPEFFVDPKLINYYDSKNGQAPPTLNLPNNKSSGITIPVSFSWENLGDNVVYRIQVSEDKDKWGYLNLNENTGNVNTYTWNAAQPNKTYYWRVKAYKDKKFDTNYSQPYKFTTANSKDDETRIISLSGDLNFGNVNVGKSSERNLTVSNKGNSTLRITDIQVPTGFSIIDYKSFSLTSNQSKNLTVRFSPQSAKSYNGYLNISSNATGGPSSISISGVGKEVVNDTRIISLSGNMNFGNVNVGEPKTQSLKVTNRGNSTLNVYQINTPNGYEVVGSSSFSLYPNEYKNVSIKFNPSYSGTYSGTINVSSNATSGPSSVSVYGKANKNKQREYIVTPRMGVFTNVPTRRGRFSCSNEYGHKEGVLRMAVTAISDDYITLTLKKNSGSLLQPGYAYIKEGDICNTPIKKQRYYRNDSRINLYIPNDLSVGQSKVYHAVIVSDADSEVNRFYSLPVKIRRTR